MAREPAATANFARWSAGAAHRRTRPGQGGERGMVTVELAFAGLFAALLTIGLAMLAGVGILVARCHETAAEVARQEARADAAAVARALADRPVGSVVDVRRSGRDVMVTVSAQARPWGTYLPAVPVSVRAVVLREGS